MGDVYHNLIRAMNDGPRPNFSRTVNKYFHSTRSNTFSVSRDMIHSEAFSEGEYSILKRRLTLKKE